MHLNITLITDETGRVVQSSERLAEPTTSLGNRDYFNQLKSRPESAMFISKPLLGANSYQWQIVFARRLNKPNGAFGGIVAGALYLSHLQEQFKRLDTGKHGVINLRDGDLHTIVRYP